MILLSGDAFAVRAFATQDGLDTEISNRKSGDSIETARATGAEGTLKAAIDAETARAKAVEAAAVCTPYHWGDTGPDNGKVFYVDGLGCHGLEAQL